MSNFIMIPIMTLEFKTITMINDTTYQLDFPYYYGVETHSNVQLYHCLQPLNGPHLHLDAMSIMVTFLTILPTLKMMTSLVNEDRKPDPKPGQKLEKPEARKRPKMPGPCQHYL